MITSVDTTNAYEIWTLSRYMMYVFFSEYHALAAMEASVKGNDEGAAYHDTAQQSYLDICDALIPHIAIDVCMYLTHLAMSDALVATKSNSGYNDIHDQYSYVNETAWRNYQRASHLKIS